jgi:spore coat protein CotH
MIASKHIDKIVLTVTAIGLALVILAMCAAPALVNSRTGDAATLGYEKKLFDTSQIITLNIKMDKADWKDLLKNAIDEKYYCCDVVINGTTFRDVGIRAKGNTSLTSVYNDPTTQRYSLKIEFGHYIKKQTCWGLDKLVLNNNYADATNMKEAVVYDMFAYLGANASLYNYAKISVNGSYWGVYLALEAVEKSFCLRNFGAKTYELYKPETAGQNKNDDSGTTQTSGDGGKKGTPDFQNGGNNAGADASDSKRPTPPDFSKTDGKPSSGTAQTGGQRDSKTTSGTAKTDTKTGSGSSSSADTATKATAKQPSADSQHTPPAGGGQMGGGNQKGGMNMSGKGADLNYSDDDLDSYSTIWDGEVTKTHEADHRRVVTALKNISKGENLETCLDVDNLLRYMAVQTFVVNLDSLTGTMAHNYYLYESGGQLNLLPWDYNLSFGGFQSSDASSTVNFPIDTPFTASLSDRQFFASLLENKTYLAKYHSYLKKLCEKYVDGGEFAKTVSRIRGQIDTLVKTDPNAFYTDKEYKAAVTMLETVVKLRAKSVEGQLAGTIPSTTDGQSKESTNLVDSSGVNLSVMGTMMGGKGGDGGPGQNAQKTGTSNGTANSTAGGTAGTQSQKDADGSGAPGGGTPPSGSGKPPAGKSGKTDGTRKSA